MTLVTVNATYTTKSTAPTVYYTALNVDLSSLTNRTQIGVTQIAGDLYQYQQPATAPFIARWDEGDATDYVDEYLDPAFASLSGAVLPTGYAPVVVAGPDGSPNGTLAAVPQTIVVTSSGEVFVKTVGNGVEGWTQTQDS